MQKNGTTSGKTGINVTCSKLLRQSPRNVALTVTAALIAVSALQSAALSQTRSAAGPAPTQSSFNIAPQPLSQALVQFSTATGIQVFVNAGLLRGINSPGVSGTLAPSAALSSLTSGTGLNYRFTNASTVAIEGAATNGGVNVEGAIRLDTVDVSGGRISATEAPYSTPAPIAHISEQTIDRFRGSSPADIFRGTPGVMSGESRNGAGGIDVNVRGMQGMGRVAVTVDGAENGVTIYQGYQGISNRSFVDPDLLAGADITKGSDVASRGIAGTVAMRTLEASDVVKQGEKYGVWVKSGFGTNTTTPRPGGLGGYYWDQATNGHPNGKPSATSDGLDRPNFLDPMSGSGSVVAAVKEENYDLLWGYAHRQQGNYFAGRNGPGAKVIDNGPRSYCDTTGCYPLSNVLSYTHYYSNGGLTSYRVGEEVLNTQLETDSWLAKGTVRFGDGQSLQLGYTGFRSEAGNILASLFSGAQAQAIQQEQTAGTKLDTGTLRYKWKPDDNDLVDLKANLWLTNLQQLTPISTLAVGAALPEQFGLSPDFRPSINSRMWGGDVTNRSVLSLDRFGSLSLTYGTSYTREQTAPGKYADQLDFIPPRDGSREEVGTFGKVAYKPLDWLTLNAGLRYSHYWSHDNTDPSTLPSSTQINPDPSRSSGGWSPSAGVTLEPMKGFQLYTNYSNALRMPTLFESVSAFTLHVNSDLRPERSRNWELGTNLIKEGLFSERDKAMVKFGWFDWNVKDYVARTMTQIPGLSGTPVTVLEIYNIDRARFSGLEFSSRYENSGFTAELAANYYLDVTFCQTADTCASKTLSADYATNQIPPKYQANLTVSQKLFDDALTVGGRVSYTAARAAGHGTPQRGLSTLIALVDWDPYWIVDVFADYKLTENMTAWARIENLTDQYYVDPLSLVNYPAPGRTFRLGLTGKFDGSDFNRSLTLPDFNASIRAVASRDWTGFYTGLSAGYDFAKFRGTMTALDGTAVRDGDATNQNLSGFSFGAQVGYNYQFSNRIVAGIEADIWQPQLSGWTDTCAMEQPNSVCSGEMANVQFESSVKSAAKWIATVRGRLGYAINDRLMIYATGGAAFMRQDEERTQYALGDRLDTGGNKMVDRAFTEDWSLTRTGFVVGGGAEYKLGHGWSLKAEGLLASFGSKEVNFPGARSGVVPDTSTTTWTGGGVYFDDPVCAGGELVGGIMCIVPSTPTTTTTPGSYSKTTGRKFLSKVNIPTIKVGLNYQF
jgi:hemoglobin/transferrin/lactoferrin receptor protein